MRTRMIWLGCLLVSAWCAVAEEALPVKPNELRPAVTNHVLPGRRTLSAPLPAAAVKEEGKEEAAPAPQEYVLVRPGMARISSGENVGTNGDHDVGSYRLKLEAPFHMDVTEVTWKQWKEVREWAMTRPDLDPNLDAASRTYYTYEIAEGNGKSDDHPVTGITWFDCLKWCNARSEKDGLVPCYTISGTILRSKADSAPDCNFSATGYRLPTALEWNYAARGGLIGKRFPWGDRITHDNANYFSAENMRDADGRVYDTSVTRGCHPKYATGAFPYTSPVKSFPPNSYGLYDMMGNVAEWIWTPKGGIRSTCGGSWDADARGLRNGITSAHDGVNEKSDTIGFRTVRAAGQ